MTTKEPSDEADEMDLRAPILTRPGRSLNDTVREARIISAYNEELVQILLSAKHHLTHLRYAIAALDTKTHMHTPEIRWPLQSYAATFALRHGDRLIQDALKMLGHEESDT